MAPLTNVEVEMEASSIITQVTREEDQITSFAQEKGDICKIFTRIPNLCYPMFSATRLIRPPGMEGNCMCVCVCTCMSVCVCALCSYKVWEGWGRSRGGVLVKKE